MAALSNAKIKKILKRKVIAINNLTIEQNNLPLKNYAIPLESNSASQVKVAFPQLSESGELVYIYYLFFPSEIRLTYFEKDKDNIEFIIARKLSKYVKEHLKTEKEIEELMMQRHKVYDLRKLVSKSEVYQNQINIYDRAIGEISGLIDKAKQLEIMYLKLIREELIGLRIQNYNPAFIQDNRISHHLQYEQLKDEYEYMKEEAKAYAELMHRTY